MIYSKVFQTLTFFGFGILMLSSCAKTKTPVPMGDAGQTLVKFIDGGSADNPGNKLVNIELNSTPLTIEALDLRRDIPNNAELQKGMNVIIKKDPGAATMVDPSLSELPDGSFTMSSNVTVVGDEYHVLLVPGQFAAPISFTIVNPSSLDATKAYGAGFTIYSADADGKILEAQKSFVVVMSSKNPYDGVYRLYGGFSRSDLPTYVGVSQSPPGYYEPYSLITSGANSVDATINTAQYGVTNTQIIYVSGGNFTYFTGVAPRINVDRATNAVTVTEGVAVVGASVAFLQNAAELADSKYYPDGIASAPNSAGKATIVAHFRWSSAGVDRITKDTFVYKFPR